MHILHSLPAALIRRGNIDPVHKIMQHSGRQFLQVGIFLRPEDELLNAVGFFLLLGKLLFGLFREVFLRAPTFIVALLVSLTMFFIVPFMFVIERALRPQLGVEPHKSPLEHGGAASLGSALLRTRTYICVWEARERLLQAIICNVLAGSVAAAVLCMLASHTRSPMTSTIRERGIPETRRMAGHRTEES